MIELEVPINSGSGGRESRDVSNPVDVFRAMVKKQIYMGPEAQGVASYPDSQIRKLIPTIAEKIVQIRAEMQQKLSEDPSYVQLSEQEIYTKALHEALAVSKEAVIDLITNDSSFLQISDGNGRTITIDIEKVKAFVLKDEHLVESDSIKEVLQEALKRDIALINTYKNRPFPLFSGIEDKLELIELELKSSRDLIHEAVDHLNQLVISKIGNTYLRFFSTVFLESMKKPTHALLILSAALNQEIKKEEDRPTRRKIFGAIRAVFNTLREPEAFSNEMVKKYIYQAIEKFWPLEVDRPNIAYDETNEEVLHFPKNGDEKLRKDGPFPVNVEFFKGSTSPLANVLEFTWVALQEQVLSRRKIMNEKAVVPLPKREKSGYYVVLQTGISPKTYKKIHIPWKLIADEKRSYESFVDHCLSELDKAPDIQGFESFVDAQEATDEDIFYDTPQHQELRKDPQSFADADLRVCLTGTSIEDTRIKNLYHTPEVSPAGMRTPTVLLINLINEHLQGCTAVSTMNAHAFTDGSEACKELETICEGVRLLPENVDADTWASLKSKIDKKSQEMYKNGDFKESTVPEQSYAQKAYEFRMGTNIERSEEDNEDNNAIQVLYDRFASDGDITLKIKEKFRVKLDQYIIFNWALMLTLDMTHVHFLDKDSNGLVPVAQELPFELKKLLQEIDKSLNPLHVRKLLASADRFNSQRDMARRHITDDGKLHLGASSIEVLRTISGIFQKEISWLGKIINRGVNEISTQSFLISALTTGKKGLRNRRTYFGEPKLRGFGTSTHSVYPLGGMGITNFGIQENSVGWRAVLRAGTSVDLLQKRFNPDNQVKSAEELEKEFETVFSENVFKIVALFDKVILE